MAKKKAYRYPLYLFVRSLVFLVSLLPRTVLQGLARAGGRASFLLVKRQRDKTLENLRFVFGGKMSEAGIQKLARRVFENFAQASIEIILLPKLSAKRLAELVDSSECEAVYRDALKKYSGAIGLSAHIGNWELLAPNLAALGFQGGVVARRIYYEPYNRWIVGLRKAAGVETFYRDDSPRRLLKLLKEGCIVGIVPDQDIDSLKGIFVEFFGREAYTTTAPAKLALAAGVPILPNFVIRQPDGRYKVVTRKLIEPDTSLDKEEAARRMTCAWMAACEDVIREYPEQWAWMHNRWKTRPADLAGRNKTVRAS